MFILYLAIYIYLLLLLNNKPLQTVVQNNKVYYVLNPIKSTLLISFYVIPDTLIPWAISSVITCPYHVLTIHHIVWQNPRHCSNLVILWWVWKNLKHFKHWRIYKIWSVNSTGISTLLDNSSMFNNLFTCTPLYFSTVATSDSLHSSLMSNGATS